MDWIVRERRWRNSSKKTMRTMMRRAVMRILKMTRTRRRRVSPRRRKRNDLLV